MRLFISLVLLFISIISFSQSKKIDSLNQELAKTTVMTEKIDILNKISSSYSRINQDSSLLYSKKALNYSLIIKDTFRIANSKQYIGDAYYTQGKYELSQKILEEAIFLYSIKNDSFCNLNRAVTLSNLSKVQRSKGDFNNALNNLIIARKIYRNYNDKPREAYVLNRLGSLNILLEQYNKSIKYYNYALIIMLEEENKQAISALYTNIGNTYSHMAENETSTTKRIALCKKAESYYLKALPIKKEIHDKKGEGICLENIGQNYSRMKKYKLAENYLFQSIKLYKETNNLNLLYNAYYILALNYKNNNEYLKAQKYAEQIFNSEETGKFKPDKILKLNNHYLLTQIYIHQNNKATFHLKKYIELKDSIYNKELIKSVNESEIKYQTELKETENQMLQQENDIQKLQIQKSEIQKYILFISFLLAFFAVIIILLYIRQRRFKIQQKTVLLEQKLLRSQMNPHFIFNSLTAIQSYILKSQPAEGAKYLSKFATLIRIVLEHSRIEYVSLEKEIESLKYYMDLQKLRYEDQFQYDIILDEKIQLDNCFIPPMLAQPFIENAIEHGIAPSEKEGIIKISFLIKTDEMIEFKVEDNGVGISDKSINRNSDSHHSLATQITKERLELLNKNKKDKIFLEVKEKINNDKVEGVLTIFCIPFIINN